MKLVLSAVLLFACALSARASVAYSQPHTGSGTLYQSSWWDPDDSDYDIHTWDSFILASDQAITEIRWRGGYLYGGGFGGQAVNFTVAIYPSIAAGSQPDVVNPPLVEYETGGNAGQTYAGTFGSVAMNDYHFTLPAPFQAAAGTKYWVYILAWHNGIPEWGFAAGSGGNGGYFRYVRGYHQYQSAPGDLCFTLIASDAPTYTINASASPANAGTAQGAGAYPVNSTASMLANANAGWGFHNWTENGAPVSSANPYQFIVTADRTLVANFVPAYVITTAAGPTFGGTTGGDGTYNQGSSVTVEAVANPQFAFVNWTEYGVPVSDSASFTFSASANRNLVANFAVGAGGRIFDFDNAPSHTSLPIDLTENGLTAHLSATGGGFSIQPADTLGFTPAGFSGLCVYPNTIFPADLVIDFSQPLTSFSILYSPQELGCDDSATLRATGYLGGSFVATHTATAAAPGTWPTELLTLDSPAPFDRAVVHYDSHPPTCQDYGVIFMADNLVVTMAVACPGDLNGDLSIDLDDLSILLVNFGVTSGATPEQGDLDGDGEIDLDDLSTLLVAFGTTCA